MRSNIEGARAENYRSHRRTHSVTVQTLTAAYTITDEEGDVMALDPGGASRNVTLPAEANHEGRQIQIINTADAAEDLVVKNPATTTIVTISQDERGWVVCAGGVWYGATGAKT